MNPISPLPPIVDTSGMLVDRQQNPSAGTLPSPNGTVAASGGFTQALTDAVGSISGLQANADQAVAGLALNQGVDIHQAMIAMDQASLGISLATTVRDKAVEAYQTLMNMQM